MTITMDYIKKIGQDLTGFDVTTKQDIPTRINYTGKWINFNKKQLDKFSKNDYIKRGVILKYKYIFVMLHEVAHYKKFKKFKDDWDYSEYCYENRLHIETLCDRYARRHTPRFIKQKEEVLV